MLDAIDSDDVLAAVERGGLIRNVLLTATRTCASLGAVMPARCLISRSATVYATWFAYLRK